MKVLRDIGLMLIALLLIACSSDDETVMEAKQPPVIDLYVFSPDKPMITRGDAGEVSPIGNESKIATLQIWIFEHNTENRISYYSPESVDNLNGTDGVAKYQLSVSEAFAQAESKPKVDVYVVANAASCGMNFSETTTRADLEAALIKKSDANDYFGLTTLTDKVPETGLPMSGVLRDVEVTGSSPVFRLQNVKLTRAVSKIRFVFCRETPAEPSSDVKVSIKSIKLNKWLIPKEEYLFLETGENAQAYHVGSYETENDDSKEFLPIVDNQIQTWEDIPKSADPLKYVYQAQNAQNYENLIEQGLTVVPPATESELRQLGPYYLRESGEKLQGVIKYQKGSETEKTANFEMKTAGDFSRNHTWIVYAYYSKSGLVAVTVVVKDWTESYRSHEVYNW